MGIHLMETDRAKLMMDMGDFGCMYQTKDSKSSAGHGRKDLCTERGAS